MRSIGWVGERGPKAFSRWRYIDQAIVASRLVGAALARPAITLLST